MKYTSFLALILAFACLVQTSQSCTCTPPKFEEGFAMANYVFYGKVKAISKLERHTTATIEMIKAWKGVEDYPSIVKVDTSNGLNDCGIDFRVGESYILYSKVLHVNRLNVSRCSRSTIFNQEEYQKLEEEHLRFLQ